MNALDGHRVAGGAREEAGGAKEGRPKRGTVPFADETRLALSHFRWLDIAK